MPGRALSGAELQSVIRQVADTGYGKWPEMKDMVALAAAVKEQKQTVQLNGTKFKIRYDTKFENAVFVSPVKDGIFVPCGYFNKDKLKGYL